MGLEDETHCGCCVTPSTRGCEPSHGNELVHRFYTHWFALDVSVRDLFPPEMAAQRHAFAHALHWVYGELVAQRAEEPVAFLAQLGRDHRKYGVLPPITRRCAGPVYDAAQLS